MRTTALGLPSNIGMPSTSVLLTSTEEPDTGGHPRDISPTVGLKQAGVACRPVSMDLALKPDKDWCHTWLFSKGYGGQQSTPTGEKSPGPPESSSGLAVPPPPNYGATSPQNVSPPGSGGGRAGTGGGRREGGERNPHPGATSITGSYILDGNRTTHRPPIGITLPSEGRCHSPGSHPPPPSTPIQGVPPRTCLPSQGISMPNVQKDRDNAYNNEFNTPPDTPTRMDKKSTDPPILQPWKPGPGNKPMYEGSDMPSADLAEEYAGSEPQPLPPDMSKLPSIPGYENVGYHGDSIHVRKRSKGHVWCSPCHWCLAELTARAAGNSKVALRPQPCHYPEGEHLEKMTAPPIPPPSYSEARKDAPTAAEEQFSSVAPLTEEQAREALLNFVSQHCCYGKTAAQNMQINKLTTSSALYYTLETFTETRTSSWELEPYRGQPVDNPTNGKPPLPWSIPIVPAKVFQLEVQELEVPHTATVLPCHGCQSQGWNRCYGCLGRGCKRCNACHGTGREWKTDAHGHRHVESCWHCNGTGRKRCTACQGDGRVVCRTCQGYRQNKCFIKLYIHFSNHIADYVSEKLELPESLLKDVSGIVIFEQTAQRVWPISYHRDQDLCNASQRLVNDQLQRFRNSKILMQRQTLKAVPTSDCCYTYNGKEQRFWVYGNERVIHAPEYPQQFCWGCSIL